jgi:hypothetical protein
MSSTLHLFCKHTNEAVALLRSGGTGVSPDGDYSNQALFSFLAYHNALGLKECSFETREITVGGKFEGAHLVSSLYELKDQQEQLEGLEENPWFIILWDRKNCLELLARNMELADNLSAYNFGTHSLVAA